MFKVWNYRLGRVVKFYIQLYREMGTIILSNKSIRIFSLQSENLLIDPNNAYIALPALSFNA